MKLCGRKDRQIIKGAAEIRRLSNEGIKKFFDPYTSNFLQERISAGYG